MTTVIAVGGNALVRLGHTTDLAAQRANAARAATAIAAVAATDHVVLTHGNGPQVGLLAMQHADSAPEAARPSLDVLDAESEGMIGYLLEQELGRCRYPGHVAALLTQVVVDPDDPAFAHPTKPIGPRVDRVEGARLARERGWVMAPDGDGLRRVVPSPEPRHIVELEPIRVLLGAGVLVIAAGGGGIPVVELPTGGHRGVEAVVDKDLTAALLAGALRASTLLLLTDVDALYDGFGTPDAVAVRRVTAEEVRAMHLPAGSMGPKAEAAARFACNGGRALIGRLDDVPGLLAGTSGTEVVAAR